MTYDTARRLVSLLDITDDQTEDPTDYTDYTIVDDIQAVIDALIADSQDPDAPEGEDLWAFLARHNINWR